jgi:hypothetical protein|tara:strand:+ start:3352 stop:4257 length:906 start_codon:yes stop_codon:yes gene_type:complete
MLHIKQVIAEVTDPCKKPLTPGALPAGEAPASRRALCVALIAPALMALIVFTTLMVPVRSLASEQTRHQNPQPFKVIYQADYRGLPISATGIRELTWQDPEGGEAPLYTLTSSALSIFAKFTEQSDFVMIGDTARPRFYRYDRTGLGRNKSIRLDFDWDQKQVTDLDSGAHWPLAETQISDRLLYQFQLQTDLLNKGQDLALGTQLSYRIQDQNTVKDYVFLVQSRVTLTTPLGPVDTYEIVRSNDQQKRSTTLWLAPAFEYMLIRFEQASSDGESFSLAIEKAYLNETPITDFGAGAPNS